MMLCFDRMLFNRKQETLMLSRFATLSRIPKGLWVVGGVSMLMDISSEIIHSLLPLFMVTTLGASVIFIGLIEGLAEATALFIKIFSGAISDYIGKKGLAVLGYGLGALSKPLFAIASSSGMILGARLIDRVGKDTRCTARCVSRGCYATRTARCSVWPASVNGHRRRFSRAFDRRRVNAAWNNDFRTIFWVAVIPGVLAVALLFLDCMSQKRRLSKTEQSGKRES
jgi:hypothetical protein